MKAVAGREEVLRWMRRLEPEPEHVLHVAELSRQLFHGLQALHELGAEEASLLETAACLHDIGWSVATDGSAHHKESARLIREHPWEHLSRAEVELVALIARYHRKALPKPEHEAYAALKPEAQNIVNQLAALLRLADALDRSHLQRVQRVTADISSSRVTFQVAADKDISTELAAAQKKGDLAEKIWRRELVFKTVPS